MLNNLLTFTQNGIYCPPADVYIDPWRPVKKALVTHGHSDHSRWGHEKYLAHHDSVPIIKHRLGEINIMGVEYGEFIKVNDVNFSFHPAGHIPGSAQVRVEYKGEVWVVSGDYKLEDDGFSVPFEPVRCHTFITECTFGLPVFRWKPQEEVMASINDWWKNNREKNLTSVLIAYSLGKAQRLINHLDPSIGTIYTHGAIENMNEVIRVMGKSLGTTKRVTADLKKEDFRGALVLAPPSAIGSTWMRKFQPFSLGIASGWMALRGTRRRRAADRGFVLSDHADWDGLNQAIKDTGAERIITTHGYTEIFTNWLKEQGYVAITEKTTFEGESIDRDAVEEEQG
jgi:putative mRNA 3-end processing factor